MTHSHNITDFNFSFQLAQKAKQELENEHQTILERITNITESEKFFINGFPVLKNIIQLQPKKADLKKIAKAIERLADLLEVYQELDNKVSVIKTVQEHPNWFAWTFGDFSKEIEKDLESFFMEEE
jgi:DNA repair exonuclease SbcCD ATPase subunit